MENPKVCPKCHRRYGDEAQFCEVDGTTLEEVRQGIVCPSCGQANPHDARFCEECGTAFYTDPSSDADEAPSEPQTRIEPPTKPEPLSEPKNDEEPPRHHKGPSVP